MAGTVMSSNGSILILIINVFCHLHPKCTLKPSLTAIKVSHEKAVNYCKKATEGVERKLLLKISANSKENSCFGVSF